MLHPLIDRQSVVGISSSSEVKGRRGKGVIKSAHRDSSHHKSGTDHIQSEFIPFDKHRQDVEPRTSKPWRYRGSTHPGMDATIQPPGFGSTHIYAATYKL